VHTNNELKTKTANEIKQKEYYNSIATTYDKHYANPSAIQYRSEVFDRFLNDQKIELKNLKVLDAMCGGGENAFYFAQKGALVSGIDISEAQCKFFAQRFPQSTIKCESIFSSGFNDSEFDFIVTESLHHLHPNVEEGVREMIRILKPGGYLMIWEPSSGSLLDLARKLWYKLDHKYFEDNEQSIDIKLVTRYLSKEARLIKSHFGGNIGHLFVMSSMQMRIPTAIVKLYAKLFLYGEKIIEKFQTQITSCWVLGIYKKN
jgi:2-polyprenyl-3-methyl-5-hydroxy-6-metoxy-1,4-benzoquinol methylase